MKSTYLIIIIMIIFPSLLLSSNKEEKTIQDFIKNHVATVEPKFKAMNLAYWNAAATGEKSYYDEVAKIEFEIRQIYSNKDEYLLLKKWMQSKSIKNKLLKRQIIVLYNSYLTNQIDTALTRQIVDKSAEIANTFNTFRGKIDSVEVTDNQIVEILKSETDNAKRKKAWEASKMVGAAVAPMLIELVKLRNKAAVQLGFKNYYEMSLVAAEQSEAEIVSIFDELKKLTDAPFAKLKSDIDDKLSKKWNIEKKDMRPWHYQDRFFQESPQVSEIDLDKYFKSKKVDELATKFYENINLPVRDLLDKSDIYERKGKYQHAFCTDIDRLGDIRVMLSIKDNHSWMSTMLHELGHAAYSKYINKELPYLLRSEAHIFVTEAIAMLMERQASNAGWLQQMVDIPESDKEAIRKAGEENLKMHGLIFSRWSQVMMRFERAMYSNPDQDLNKLWWNLVEEYQMVQRDENRNAPDWAAKIHLAQSPVYYHNYELGELLACQLNNYIVKNIIKDKNNKLPSYNNQKAIGDYLRKNIFAKGASMRWDELIKHATKENLTAKYFADEYVK